MNKFKSMHLMVILITITLMSCNNSELSSNNEPIALNNESGVSTSELDVSEVEQPDDFSFIGINPPESEPKPFGLGWFEGGFHSAPVFSPDGMTFWWSGRWASQIIYKSEMKNGEWTPQEQVILSENIKSYRDPFISPDGEYLYFISTDPIDGQSASGKENLWITHRENDQWGEPEPLPALINQYDLHWTFSVASNYDLYFSALIEGNPEILKASFINGEYLEPIRLGPPVNTSQLEFCPNIAPDQSFLLFSRIEDHSSPAHLYISYATEDSWTEPVSIENVEECISPIVTPDGKYVIYLKGDDALEWRDTTFIELLRP
ncbi:MAG: exo-alpha-sialidase [Clostridia bacterium]|nr:exo-alpha-sialidase [Clostridia bacterium]